MDKLGKGNNSYRVLAVLERSEPSHEKRNVRVVHLAMLQLCLRGHPVTVGQVSGTLSEASSTSLYCMSITAYLSLQCLHMSYRMTKPTK